VTPFRLAMLLGTLSRLIADASGQATSGELLGGVRDPSGAIISEARVIIRNIETNNTWEGKTGSEGRFRFALLPVSSYEVEVSKRGFATYVRAPIILRLNQSAELYIRLELSGVAERLIVSADAPLLNTTNPEIGVNFDSRRVSELPLAPDRNILNLALQVAGVSQLSRGNTDQASGDVNFSVNGSRLRSNNLLIDGQDVNHPNLTGASQEVNNPDTVAEFRLITSQFAPEYGRATGSVVNIITKTGTNSFHGSGYWFYNGNQLNSRSNLDEKLFDAAPWRIENQVAGTLGGPIVKNKTFFFGSILRWTDHSVNSGTAITGVPTAEGQDLLRSVAGARPQVRALLEHLAPAQFPIDSNTPITVAGQTVNIPLGTLSGSAPNQLDVWQSSIRLDHTLSKTHTLGGRYLFDDRFNLGGQAVPAGLTEQTPQRRQSISVFLNSFSPHRFNELRASYQRVGSHRSALNTKAEEIPNTQITGLGLTGANPSPTRTAIVASQRAA